MKINYLFIFILFLIILNILFKQSNIENFKNEKKNILIIGGTSGIGKKIIPIFSPDINNVIVVGRKNIKLPSKISRPINIIPKIIQNCTKKSQ